MNAALRELVFAHDELADLDPAERRLALREIVLEAGFDDVGKVVERLAADIDGFGPLSDLMDDPGITDILVNGPAETWIEKEGRLAPASGRFDDREALLRWCERTVSRAGGRLDTSRPIADVRLPDGSRLHAVLPPIAPDGPLVSIRRVPSRMRSLSELVELGLMSEGQSEVLHAHIEAKRSICVSGATGVGKTTLLNALLLLVPPSERVVVIEELPELVNRAGIVSLIARPPNAEERGLVTLEDLVRASLRMRPDRIVIGEVRGPEALPALSAMSTGHEGSLLSVHARSADHARARVADLALTSAHAPPRDVLVSQAHELIEVRVHIERRDGKRIVTQIDG